MSSGKIDITKYTVSKERGFLPLTDPLTRLPAAFDAWEEVAQNLPKLLVTTKLRAKVDGLPMISTDSLRSDAELERAMAVLSYIGHSYVWFGGKPAEKIPAVLAVPWHAISERLGRPPILSYASYSLHNWRRIDPKGPAELGNIALLLNFFGGADEEWFVLVHVDIETRCGAAMVAAADACAAASANDAGALTAALSQMHVSLEAGHKALLRMPELCDPYIYYHRVRPYIHGWKNHPILVNGLIYDGVTAYGGKPQQFRGETGAQSSIVPVVDATLGIAHAPGLLKDHLIEMQLYMPPKHRAYINELEARSTVRDCVKNLGPANPKLKEAYNNCVDVLTRFRSLHLEYAADYIHKQAQANSANSVVVGTGGTPFMAYLAKHRDETESHKI